MQLMKLVLELCSFCQVDEMLIFQVARNDGLVDEKNTVTAGMKVSSSSSLSSSSSSIFFQQVACHVPPLLLILTQSHKVFISHSYNMGLRWARSWWETRTPNRYRLLNITSAGA